jgi:hypothetical protein
MGGFVALSGPSDPVFAQQVALCFLDGTAIIRVVTMVIVVLVLVLVLLLVLLVVVLFLCNDLPLLGFDCICVERDRGNGRRVVVSGP